MNAVKYAYNVKKYSSESFGVRKFKYKEAVLDELGNVTEPEELITISEATAMSGTISGVWLEICKDTSLKKAMSFWDYINQYYSAWFFTDQDIFRIWKCRNMPR